MERLEEDDAVENLFPEAFAKDVPLQRDVELQDSRLLPYGGQRRLVDVDTVGLHAASGEHEKKLPASRPVLDYMVARLYLEKAHNLRPAEHEFGDQSQVAEAPRRQPGPEVRRHRRLGALVASDVVAAVSAAPEVQIQLHGSIAVFGRE